jgi:hypothetical protein
MTNTEITLYNENDLTPEVLFRDKDGLKFFIERIKKVANEIEIDVTTEKGRKSISSLAHKISKAKRRVDEVRKKENEEHQAVIKLNNEKGKKAVNELQQLQDEVRKPVTDWENRIKAHQQAILDIENKTNIVVDNWDNLTLEQVRDAFNYIESYNREWEEFTTKASNVKKTSIKLINEIIGKKVKLAEEQVELERLKKAEELRLQKEREQAIAKKAAEDAKIAAELKAKNEAEALLRRETEERRQKELAEQRIKELELAKIEQAKQAEIDKQNAIKQAEEKREAEKKAKQAEIDRRNADLEHKNKVNFEAIDDLSKIVSRQDAEKIIKAIAGNTISNVSINY